mgnify:CR=1 FL=1
MVIAMKLIFPFLVASFLMGCATNTGAISIGKDSWMLSRQAGSGFVGEGTIKADAFQEATVFCQNKGKFLQVTNVRESEPPFINGNWYKAEISFMCLDQTDQRFVSPNLRSEPDTVVRVHAEINEQPSKTKDLYAELVKLDDLLKKGIIDESEFKKLKAKLIEQ